MKPNDPEAVRAIDRECVMCGFLWVTEHSGDEPCPRCNKPMPAVREVVEDANRCDNCGRELDMHPIFSEEGDCWGNIKPVEVVEDVSEPIKKANYVGAPAIFKLEMACKQINDAFDGFGCYLVGSATQRLDWRDVDVRYIMGDDEFTRLFPNCHIESALWELDPCWTLLTVSIAVWMREQTGLPVDFQIQPQTFANARHNKPRHAMGLRVAKKENPDGTKW